jgi:hypothetical protein
MFIRRYACVENGNRQADWALVESFRTARGPRQRVVAWIGKLDEAGRRYPVGTPKSLLKQYEQELLADDWHKIREGIEAELLPVPAPEDDDELSADGASNDEAAREQQENFILCRSWDRGFPSFAVSVRRSGSCRTSRPPLSSRRASTWLFWTSLRFNVS